MTLTLDPRSLPALKVADTDTTNPPYATNIRFSCEIYNASGVISHFTSKYEVQLGVYPGAPIKSNTCFDPLRPLKCIETDAGDAGTTTPLSPPSSSGSTGTRRQLYGPLEEGIHDGLLVNARYAAFLKPKRTVHQRGGNNNNNNLLTTKHRRYHPVARRILASTTSSNTSSNTTTGATAPGGAPNSVAAKVFSSPVKIDMTVDLGQDLEIFLLQRDTLNQATRGTEGVFTGRMFILGNPIPLIKKISSTRAEETDYHLKDIQDKTKRTLFHKLTARHTEGGPEGLGLGTNGYLLNVYQDPEDGDSACAPSCAIANITFQVVQKNCSGRDANMILSPKLGSDEKSRNCICKEDFTSELRGTDMIGGVKVPKGCTKCPTGKTKVVHKESKMDPDDKCYCRFGEPKLEGGGKGCEQCAKGKYWVKTPLNTPAAWSCRDCSAGTISVTVDTNFTNADGSFIKEKTCAQCPAGKKSSDDRETCDECGERQYSEAGEAQCKTCYAGTELSTDSLFISSQNGGSAKGLTVSCAALMKASTGAGWNGSTYSEAGNYPECHPCRCKEGDYFDTQWDPYDANKKTEQPCQHCEKRNANGKGTSERTFCKEGTYGTAQIVLRPGYWRFNTSSVLYHRCDQVDSALGDRANMFQPCLGGKKSMCGPVFTSALYAYLKKVPTRAEYKERVPLVTDWAGLPEKIRRNPSSTLSATGFDFKGNAVVETYKGGRNTTTSVRINGTANVTIVNASASASASTSTSTSASTSASTSTSTSTLPPAHSSYTGAEVEVVAELLRLAYDTIDPRNDKVDLKHAFLSKMKAWTTAYDGSEAAGKAAKGKVRPSEANSSSTSVVGFYGGVKCVTCPYGSGYNDGICQECPDGAINVLILMGYLLIILIIVIIMTVIQVKASDKRGEGEEGFAGLTMEQHARRVREFGTASGGEADYKKVVVGIFRILLSYAQVASFAKMLPVEWPSQIRRFFEDMMRWTTPRLHMSSLECAVRSAGELVGGGGGVDPVAAYRAKFFMIMSFPLLTFIVPAIFFSLFYLLHRKKPFSRVDVQEHEMDYEEVGAILETRIKHNAIAEENERVQGGEEESTNGNTANTAPPTSRLRTGLSSMGSQVKRGKCCGHIMRGLTCTHKADEGVNSQSTRCRSGDCVACGKVLTDAEVDQIVNMDPIHTHDCPICSHSHLRNDYSKASHNRILKRQQSRGAHKDAWRKGGALVADAAIKGGAVGGAAGSARGINGGDSKNDDVDTHANVRDVRGGGPVLQNVATLPGSYDDRRHIAHIAGVADDVYSPRDVRAERIISSMGNVAREASTSPEHMVRSKSGDGRRRGTSFGAESRNKNRKAFLARLNNTPSSDNSPKPLRKPGKRSSLTSAEAASLTRAGRKMAHWCVTCEQGVHAGECVRLHYKMHWWKRALDYFWITVLVVMFLEYT